MGRADAYSEIYNWKFYKIYTKRNKFEKAFATIFESYSVLKNRVATNQKK